MKINLTMDLPTNIAKDYNAGKVDILNAVVRSKKTGRIVRYVKLKTENVFDSVKMGVSKITGKNLLIGLGITVAAVTVGGIINLVVTKKSEEKTVKIPKCINDFQKYFRKYLKETQKGVINIKTINSLIDSLDEVEKLKSKEVRIDFSANELRSVLEKIYDFTNSMNEEYNDERIKIKSPTKSSSKNIVYLKDYLETQKQVIEKIS